MHRRLICWAEVRRRQIVLLASDQAMVVDAQVVRAILYKEAYVGLSPTG